MKQRVKESQDKAGTRLGQGEVHLGGSRTTGQYFNIGCPVPVTCPETCPDWSELEEKEFGFVLATIETREELEGVANRRKFLNAPQLPTWSQVQIQMIKRRKWELEHE